MKKLLLSIASFAISGFAFAQTPVTVTLRPGVEGKDATIWYITSQSTDKGPTNTTNYGHDTDLPAMEWTFSGSEGTKQSLLDFDLTSIPQNAVISSAKLSLYHATGSGDDGHSTLSGSNEVLIRRVTSAWEENIVTWNTKPSTTSQNEVTIPASTSSTQNFPDLDVTELVKDMLDDLSGSHGFMFEIKTKSYYRKMIFASGDHSNPELHPKLEITFTVPDNCAFYRPGVKGKDATIWYITSQTTSKGPTNTTNYGHDRDIPAMEWTYDGSQGRKEGLLAFNLDAIPSGSTVTEATLALYHGTGSGDGNHSTLSGSNEVLIKRVTSAWEEYTVTYDTKPSVTSLNEVELPATTSGTQNFTDINVTSLVKDMLTHGNHGFHLSVKNPAYYRQMIFASGDHSDAGIHPSLKVCFSDVVSGLGKGANSAMISVAPNPSNGMVKVTSKSSDKGQMILYNISGDKILGQEFSGEATLNIENLPSGVYYLNIFQGERSWSEKIVKY
ncbi:MAG: DNRLRE domain-containing protein [Cytophagaceae bacterium]